MQLIVIQGNSSHHKSLKVFQVAFFKIYVAGLLQESPETKFNCRELAKICISQMLGSNKLKNIKKSDLKVPDHLSMVGGGGIKSVVSRVAC